MHWKKEVFGSPNWYRLFDSLLWGRQLAGLWGEEDSPSDGSVRIVNNSIQYSADIVQQQARPNTVCLSHYIVCEDITLYREDLSLGPMLLDSFCLQRTRNWDQPKKKKKNKCKLLPFKYISHFIISIIHPFRMCLFRKRHTHTIGYGPILYQYRSRSRF